MSEMVAYATDSFNRANENPMVGWQDNTVANRGFQIVSNAATPDVLNGTCFALYVAGSIRWQNDQYVQAKITVDGTTDNTGLGVIVRGTVGPITANETFYTVYVNKAATDNIRFIVFFLGTVTPIATRTTTWVDGDTLRLEAISTTFRIYQNGTQLGADITDSTLVAGLPGLFFNDPVTSCLADDWEAGGIPRYLF